MRLKIEYSFYLLVLVFLTASCKEKPVTSIAYHHMKGKAMGTFYNITLETDLDIHNLQTSVDSILNAFEDELSTYRPQSTISRFNASKKGICVEESGWFYQSYKTAQTIYKATDGYFDPTVAPLVNFWGFGYDHQAKKTAEQLDTIKNLMDLVGMDKLTIREVDSQICIDKTLTGQMLDLNASAKGMGVDVVANLIQSRGINNYLVEIGGEVRAKGLNKHNKTWTLGINKPSPDASVSDLLMPVKVADRGMATSGNYRNFYKDGKLTFAHIISPKTGMSQPTDVLSATVLAKDCETADGYATALMAIGLHNARSLSNQLQDIDVCLIYHDVKADTLAYFFSNGFDDTQKN